MRSINRGKGIVLAALAGAPWGPGCGAPPSPPPTDQQPDTQVPRTPQCGAQYNKYKNPYFGDMHSHTSHSLDAYTFGTRAEPLDAYAFAAGHSLTLPNGNMASGQVTVAQGTATPGPTVGPLNPPLDFMGVTDHSEWLGQVYACTTDSGDSQAAYASAYCKELRANTGFKKLTGQCQAVLSGEGGAMYCPSWSQTMWDRVQYVSNHVNQPCTFTTFNAYEWTYSPQVTDPVSGMPSGATEHRNVFFANETVPAQVYPSNDPASNTPAGLWNSLHGGCTGACDAITIPHNMNKSLGQDLQLTAEDSAAPYAEQYQILAEVHQHKGNSECLSDTYDTGETQACTFEILPTANYAQYEPAYLRPALKRGLAAYQPGSGHAPLQLGIVGATDTHNGTPGNVAETGWPGHAGKNDDTADERVSGTDAPFQASAVSPPAGYNESTYNNPGGLTGVWATENTRPAIWAALKRRETWATSGTRIKVRFYLYTPGAASPCSDPDFPKQVVDGGGLPMGSTTTSLSGPPSFVVYALQDQRPLDSFDIIKGYYDPATKQGQESVHHISLSGGSPYCTTWTDPKWRAGQPAFYYVRVLEAKGPRWSVADCATWMSEHGSYAGAEACKAPSPTLNSVNIQIQERAWTSPIWYLP